MHHTFNGLDVPGDTQPDSQMHRQWTSGIHSEAVESPHLLRGPKSLFIQHEDDEENDLPSDDNDIVESSQEHHHAAVTSPTIVDLDDHGDNNQDSLGLTSPFKFETPGLVGRKRASSGQMLSSAARTDTTPATVASASAFGTAFGNVALPGGAHMSLTQIWNNTQAPTSPVVGGASEDVVFTRPSPNFTNMRHSSPGPAYSSPIKALQPETPKSDPIMRSSSEPRTEYVTMEQSQEKRRGSDGEEQRIVIPQDSWEELSRQVQHRKAREQFYRQAAKSLSHISAPTSASSRSTRKPTARANYPSPGRSRAFHSVVESRSAGEDDNDSMDGLSQVASVKGHDTDDSPDELSQDIPTTARTQVKQNSSNNRVQVPKTSSHPYRTPSDQASHNASQQATPSSQLQRESQIRPTGSQSMLRATFHPHSSKDSVAVMDSQPDVLADFDSIPPPKLLRFPSSPSVNQYSINQTTMAVKTGYTSQVISSSMPPLPPKSSLDELDGAHEEEISPEERVPSSPPILTHDEDIEYDEHTYDEYAEELLNEDAVDPAAAEDDVLMEDEDELPVVKEEVIDTDAADLDKEESSNDELDLVQPRKVDLETDQVVPETMEHEAFDDDAHNDAEATLGVQRIPRIERRDTVPETDALDETQPSFFPNDAAEPVDNDTDILQQTDSTEQFATAQEEQSELQINRPGPQSSREDGSDTIQAGDRIRSINDIYNLPETQQSAAEEEIEMPRLSGLDEDDESVQLPTSPALTSAKRRKVTYAAKRNVFRSPAKPVVDLDALSDPPATSFLDQEQATCEDTPLTASALRREDQGAAAATRAREKVQAPYSKPATLKTQAVPRPAKSQNQKRGALKPVSKELIQSLSSPGNSPLRSRGSAIRQAPTPVTPTKPKTNTIDQQGDVAMPNVEGEPDELAESTPRVSNIERVLEELSQQNEKPVGDMLVPNRVFASWPGSHYYPATCIGRATSRQLRIRYDDGNTTTMDAIHVRALNLRTGDHVKVDEVGMKKHTYVVVGFKDKIDDLDGEQFPNTDRLGYTTVVVEEKRRDSMPAAKATQPTEHISVPMASIYLTTGLWTRLRDRSFNFSPPDSPAKSVSRIGTPMTEAFATPSFTRRGIAIPSLLKDATARAASVASTTRSGSSVFSNMAFVLTSTATDVDKEGIAKTIKANGGQILEHGFHELFDYESSDASSSQSRRRSTSPDGTVGLTLKHAYKDLGFVALISDSHSRSTKYIQALALNVPCLHVRWIQDSLNASRAALFVRYLLPAGVSKFLDPHGVVRSRTMRFYDPAAEDVSFAQIVQDRDLLLRNQTVLLVTGKSKKEIEKRQPFVFLTHALGSASVGRCADLADASEMLNDGHWDWVYVDNGDQGVADAAAELFGTERPVAEPKAKKGKKRKRDESEEKEDLIARVEFDGRKIRITCAEFVIQSLILGALIEE